MLAACGTLALAGDLAAQDPATPPSVAFIGVAFDGTHANSIQPGDSGTALQAADRMRAVIQETSGVALVDTARVSAEVRKVERPGITCSTDVACARRVGRALGARWVAVGRLRKVSNLIWYLSGQLVEVESGRVALNDELELKGPRDEMLPRGAASLARRMARTANGELGTSSSRD
jgi:hypothetical protein